MQYIIAFFLYQLFTMPVCLILSESVEAFRPPDRRAIPWGSVYRRFYEKTKIWQAIWLSILIGLYFMVAGRLNRYGYDPMAGAFLGLNFSLLLLNLGLLNFSIFVLLKIKIPGTMAPAVFSISGSLLVIWCLHQCIKLLPDHWTHYPSSTPGFPPLETWAFYDAIVCPLIAYITFRWTMRKASH